MEGRNEAGEMPAIAAVDHYAPGAEAVDLQAGHLVLTHGEYWTSRIIRFGQRMRFRGERRPYAHWNHVALVLDESGNIAEALSGGVREQHISKYAGTDYYVVAVDCSNADRAQIVAFAQAVLAARYRYGWVTIAGLALTLAFGSRYTFGKIGTAICSGFASEALTRMGAIFARPPAYMMPADVAEHFGALPVD